MREITSLSEIQTLELNIFRKVDRFCRDNHIKYFLDGGTLLGAIRHKGFIPWDDDIDIYMPRKDYQKFKELFPQLNEDKELQVVSWDTKTFYGRPMAKVIDLRTVLIETNYHGDDPLGVFIDIFPLDGVPSKALWRFFHEKYLHFLKRLLYMKLIYPKSLPLSSKQICRWMEDSAKSTDYNSADIITCYASFFKVFKKECFDDVIELPFCDIQAYVPVGYDEILKELYGDYMKLPPESQRIPRHEFTLYWR